MPLTRCGAVPGTGYEAARHSGTWGACFPQPASVDGVLHDGDIAPGGWPGEATTVAAPVESPAARTNSRQLTNSGFSRTLPPRRRGGRSLSYAVSWARCGGAPGQVPHPLYAREPAVPTPGFLGHRVGRALCAVTSQAHEDFGRNTSHGA
jgi:hypothetical protein